MRSFSGKTIELLAPAGNFEIFEGIVNTGCDAIYFGGQQLNMRLIRKGYNFSNEELKQAILMARDNGKKSYITVNNLVDECEIDKAKTYLSELAAMSPDAIIVQDYAILKLVKEMGLNLPIHASVMMNVHNLKMLEALEAHGVTRTVLSREMTLSEVAYLKAHSKVELEYFTHGDMCVAHGAQCYHSALVFGMSSNRGKCLKPCRWWFNEGNFPLAVKDLCLYPHLPQMIHAGVTSFKIEGRMREKAFITELVNRYAEAFDRYIDDPVGFDPYEGYDWFEEHKKRDLSTAYAFGNPGVENRNTRFEGTGKFYSTGKMFSTPTEEQSLDESQINQLMDIYKTVNTSEKKTALSIRVHDESQAMTAIEAHVGRIYLSSEVYYPNKPWKRKAIERISSLCKEKGIELYMTTPRMMNEQQFDEFSVWLSRVKPYADGLLVTNLGAIKHFKELNLPMVGDFSLNVCNSLSGKFLMDEGLTAICPSVELSANALKDLLENEMPMDLVVHGHLISMYMSHDLYQAEGHVGNEPLKISNEAGTFTVLKDQYDKNHILNPRCHALLPIIPELCGKIDWLRIEAGIMGGNDLKKVLSAYQEAIGNKAIAGDWKTHLPNERFSIGALKF